MGRRTQGGPTLNGMNSAKQRKPPGARALKRDVQSRGAKRSLQRARQ